MRLIDANLLLYAYNPSFSAHAAARAWLEATLSAPEPVGLAWVTLVAYVRIGTNPRAFPDPLTLSEAVAHVDSWLALPCVQVVNAGPRHWEILRGLLPAAQARGNLATDAHLAAIALEHGALLCSTDRDFARFQGLRFTNPLQ